MNVQHPVRFDLDALRARAGAKVFERGQEYHEDDEVEILAIDEGRVRARVTGTDDYQVDLTGRGDAFGGSCSCPAYANWGFCKHMVAVALATNAAGATGEAEGEKTLPRIRAHLKAKGVDALVDLILDLAEADTALWRRLDLAAVAVASDDRTTEARLRKAIDSATQTRGYDDAAGWASGVEAVLDVVGELTSAGRAGIALRLAEHAIDRIESALDEIDDSEGECGASITRAVDIHRDAVRVVRPDPVELAKELFAREIDGLHEAFHDAATTYADVLGDAGLAEYRRLATAGWDELPPRSGGGRQTYESSYYHLRSILDAFAERDGDIDARIALRSKDLSTPWAYLQLAEFCLSQGREAEALRRAEEGLWIFDDGRAEQRLVLFTADLLSKQSRPADATALLRKTFDKEPSLELYRRLRKIGGPAVVAQPVAVLERHCGTDAGPHKRASADLLIEILILEKMFDAAWIALRKHGASAQTKEALASACDTSYPSEALRVYAERIDALAEAGNGAAYKQAVAFVARMASSRSPAEHASYVATLKVRFSRKRNLMKLLS